MSRSPLILFLIIFIILPLLSFSQTQKTTFLGSIIDENESPVPGATVMLLHAADSVLAQFTSSDAEGRFILKNVPKGEYLINVSYLGFEPVFLPVTAGNAEETSVGIIKMKIASKTLSEVQVTADVIPIEISKDTISYNADAFQTQPNAVVEDLLKKLPGIEVGADGTIKAQGEEVQKVTVDGKEFFGTDPKIATKNLPAKAIKKVKVFDKQSDMAQFTGVDDGEREKTIDLQLKEEFKKGVFGKGEAGYGTDGKYMARAAINKFTKSAQLSFLGQLNNINEQNFSFNDMMNFSGGMRNMMGGGGTRQMEYVVTSDISDRSNRTGLVTTAAGGLNFNWHKSKNYNIRSSYFFNGVENTLYENVFRQNLTGISFDTDETTDEITENYSHRLSLESEIKIDSTQQINISGRGSIGNGIGIAETFLQNRIPGDIIENESETTEDNESDNLSLRANGNYMIKLGSRGRSISTMLSGSKNEQDNRNNLKAITEYFTTGDQDILDQLQLTNSNNSDWQGQLAFTEPIAKRQFLEFNYLYSEAVSDYDKDVADIVNNTSLPNDELSNTYRSIFQYHRPGMTFRYTGNIHNINVSLQYQMSELDGQLQEGADIHKKYNHFLPRLIWRNDIGNGKNLSFRYTTRISQPSITQLSPVTDNTDPTRLYIGNPGLDAEYTHNINLSYHAFTQFSSTSFFVSLNGTLTKDKIITSRTIDEQLVEVYSPINIDQESGLSFYASFGRPFKPIHSRFNINLNINYTNTENLINGQLLDANRWSRNGGITFSNLNSKVLEYQFGGSWTFTDRYYREDEGLNQSTLMHNYFVDVTLTFWKKWRLNGSYNYNLYTSNEFGSDQSLPMLGGSISRYLLPGDRGQIVLSVFDALDENRGLSRNVDINYIEEIRSNAIGRYAMLKFVYSLNSPGKEPPGAIRIIEQRR